MIPMKNRVMVFGASRVNNCLKLPKDPLEKEIATHSSTLVWKFHGQRSLIGYSLWGHKESDTTE